MSHLKTCPPHSNHSQSAADDSSTGHYVLCFSIVGNGLSYHNEGNIESTSWENARAHMIAFRAVKIADLKEQA